MESTSYYGKNSRLVSLTYFGLHEQLDKFRHDKIPWHKVDVIVRTPTPTKNLKLIQGMLNYCGCGELDLPRGNFIHHTNEKHNGYAPPNSRINQPHWIYGIIYNNDTEMLYCRTQAERPVIRNY